MDLATALLYGDWDLSVNGGKYTWVSVLLAHVVGSVF